MWEKVTPQSALVLVEGKKSRTISSRIIQGNIALAPMTVELNDEWSSEIARVGFMEKGEIANFGAGTNLVTPEAQQAIDGWLVSQGIRCTPRRGPAVPLACTGATFHHDAQSYAEEVFCVVWLSDDTPWDLYFPCLDVRIPLKFGTTVLFDAAQPHGVVAHGETGFYEDAFEFATGIFLSQDLFVGKHVRDVMGITSHSRKGIRGFHQLNKHGFREELDPNTGSWAIRNVRSKSTFFDEPVEEAVEA
jgi:hypothetical protein